MYLKSNKKTINLLNKSSVQCFFSTVIKGCTHGPTGSCHWMSHDRTFIRLGYIWTHLLYCTSNLAHFCFTSKHLTCKLCVHCELVDYRILTSRGAKQKNGTTFIHTVSKFGGNRITVAFSTAKVLNNLKVQELYVLGLLLALFPNSHLCSGPAPLDFSFPERGFSSSPLVSASSGAFLLVGEPFFSQLIIILLLAEAWGGA